MVDWIIREEMVPDHDGRVLVTTDWDGSRIVDIDCYSEYHDSFQLERKGNGVKVVAWAELPEPWRGEEEEDEQKNDNI